MSRAALPKETALLLSRLEEMQEISAFRLVGGTAIALQHGHRLSHDLDFLHPETRLPRRKIEAIIKNLTVNGWSAEMVSNENARLYWENEGDDLYDHQQDWLVGGVKLTFFTTDGPEQREWLVSLPTISSGAVLILESEPLFQMKCRLLAQRTTARDLFDLWYYCQHLGKTTKDIIKEARKANPHLSEDVIKLRLAPSRPPPGDPGFASQLADAPRDFSQLKERMLEFLDLYEQEIARELARK
jgi:predicted nucleotidyltransferase component of viral defense system